MSTDLAVSMDELARESAELLPSRETLCCYSHGHGYGFSGGNVFIGQQAVGGNTVASGGLLGLALLDGNAINIL